MCYTFSDASTAIREKYKATNTMLGEGAFGQVFLFEARDDPEQKFAVKIMLKQWLRQQQLELIREEIAVLSSLDHENIVNYVESYEDNRYLYIVMEYIEEATDLEHVIKNLSLEQD